MPYFIEDSVALVTAGTSGLGLAVAQKLAQAGARVVLNYASNDEAAKTAVKDLQTKYPRSSDSSNDTTQTLRYMAIKADMSRPEEIRRLVKETIDAMGKLDIVISNAGWTKFATFNDMDQNADEEVWDRCYAVNVKSHFFLLHASRKYLDEAKGTFILTSSVAGVKPSGSSIAYSVTKAAQLHLAKALAMIVAPCIRVNCVSPGFMKTNWISSMPESKINEAKERTLLKMLTNVEDVADQVVLLARSESVTGANFVMDSGFSL